MREPRGKGVELHLSVTPQRGVQGCVRTCSSKLQGLVVKSQEFCEWGCVGSAAENQPWWKYRPRSYEQTLQIKLDCWLLNIYQHSTGLSRAAQSWGLLIPPEQPLVARKRPPGETQVPGNGCQAGAHGEGGVRTCGWGPYAPAASVQVRMCV